MCGFVGYISRRHPVAPEHADLVRRMNGRLLHRGPDHQAYAKGLNYHWGFSRLSIIDLDPRANQPFAYGNFLAMLNGEIYNYRELRQELEARGLSFSTSSDTEVFVAAYAVWGRSCFDRFVGMFAAIIYDKETERFLLVRDQLGIKPLYLVVQDDHLVFASELKCFLDYSRLALNEAVLVEQLTFGLAETDQTLFAGVRQVLPGQYLEYDQPSDCLKATEYYSLADSFEPKNRKWSYGELKEILAWSVELHTRCDVPYGTQLSGGVDSSYVTALVAEKKSELRTYSIAVGSPNPFFDESRYQDEVSRRWGTLHTRLPFTEDDLVEELARSIYHFDCPLHHPNIAASLLVNRAAKADGLKVVLSGDGADELFTGYQWHMGLPEPRTSALFRPAYASHEVVRSVLPQLPFSVEGRLRCLEAVQDSGDAIVYYDQRCYLQKWLQRQDRIGMAASIEIRVPLCCVPVYDYVNHIPHADKTNGGTESKVLLKKVGEDYLSRDLLYRRKNGFAIPISDWLRHPRGLGRVLALLSDDQTRGRGLYDRPALERCLQAHLSGTEDHGRLLWLLVNLELWHRLFIDRSLEAGGPGAGPAPAWPGVLSRG
jgi:asparagine synthase (glutamine-hydrolysing)